MKLFVWANPYKVWYGNSLLFAVAETEEQARMEARQAPGYAFGEFARSNPGDIPLGAPTRVLDLPCAEWHEWSE
jgi:hypothetical protein